MKKTIKFMGVMLAGGMISSALQAEPASNQCHNLPSFSQLETALQSAVGEVNGGLNTQMWATLVDRNGIVCAVARSADAGEQWPGSRVISAQKANTANAFSLPGLPLSTANLYEATQPGESLFGLQHSNPVDTSVAYKGPAKFFGTAHDPMVGSPIGGVNVFGGGLPLYESTEEGSKLIGALGVSGDTSCADHNIAWRVRDILGLDFLPPGVGTPGDNIIFGLGGGFGHPNCLSIDGLDNQDVNDAVIAAHPLN